MTGTGALVFGAGLILSILAALFVLEWRLSGLKSAARMIAFVVGGMVITAGIVAFWFWLGGVIG